MTSTITRPRKAAAGGVHPSPTLRQRGQSRGVASTIPAAGPSLPRWIEIAIRIAFASDEQAPVSKGETHG